MHVICQCNTRTHPLSLSLSPDAIYSALAICANLFTSSSLLTVIRSILVIKPLNHVNNISLSLAHTHTTLSVWFSPWFHPTWATGQSSFFSYIASHSTEQNIEWITIDMKHTNNNINARRIQLSNEFIQQKYFLIKLNCNRVIREYHQIWSTFHKFVCYITRFARIKCSHVIEIRLISLFYLNIYQRAVTTMGKENVRWNLIGFRSMSAILFLCSDSVSLTMKLVWCLTKYFFANIMKQIFNNLTIPFRILNAENASHFTFDIWNGNGFYCLLKVLRCFRWNWTKCIRKGNSRKKSA